MDGGEKLRPWWGGGLRQAGRCAASAWPVSRTRRRARDHRPGDHLGGGDHKRGANTRPHRLEQVGEAGATGARRSEARGGGQSSASSGNGLRGTGRPPEGLCSSLVAPGARWGARFGRRRAETTTTTWTAAGGFCRGGEEGYGVRAAKRREGNGGGAHRGCSGRRSGLGDAPKRARGRTGDGGAAMGIHGGRR